MEPGPGNIAWGDRQPGGEWPSENDRQFWVAEREMPPLVPASPVNKADDIGAQLARCKLSEH